MQSLSPATNRSKSSGLVSLYSGDRSISAKSLGKQLSKMRLISRSGIGKSRMSSECFTLSIFCQYSWGICHCCNLEEVNLKGKSDLELLLLLLSSQGKRKKIKS